MLIYRRWLATLIFALLAVIFLLSTSSALVRADSSLIIPDVPGASVHGHDNADSSMSLLLGTATATVTPALPFTCEFLSLSNKRLVGNQFQIDIQNDNIHPALISRVQITWPNIPAIAQMGLTQMSLNAMTIWNGSDPQTASTTTTTDTVTKPGTPPFSSTSMSIRTVDALATGVYAAAFNVPQLLAIYNTSNRYAVTFTFDDAMNPTSLPCVLTSPASIPTATPTLAGGPSPTPTPHTGLCVKFNDN